MVDGLSKGFGSRQAVTNLGLTVPRGSILALLGPNGSGKTTALACLAGLLRPDGGRIVLDGVELGPDRSRQVALVPEDPDVFAMLSVWEHLVFVARSSRLPRGWEAAATALLGRLSLTAERDRLGEALSTGARRKLLIAAGVLAGSRVLLLDEPLAGLDLGGRRELRSLLRDLAGEGRVVVVSTHLLHDVDAFCDRLAILRDGRCLMSGAVDQVRRDHGGRSLEDIVVEAMR